MAPSLSLHGRLLFCVFVYSAAAAAAATCTRPAAFITILRHALRFTHEQSNERGGTMVAMKSNLFLFTDCLAYRAARAGNTAEALKLLFSRIRWVPPPSNPSFLSRERESKPSHHDQEDYEEEECAYNGIQEACVTLSS